MTRKCFFGQWVAGGSQTLVALSRNEPFYSSAGNMFTFYFRKKRGQTSYYYQSVRWTRFPCLLSSFRVVQWKHNEFLSLCGKLLLLLHSARRCCCETGCSGSLKFFCCCIWMIQWCPQPNTSSSLLKRSKSFQSYPSWKKSKKRRGSKLLSRPAKRCILLKISFCFRSCNQGSVISYQISVALNTFVLCLSSTRAWKTISIMYGPAHCQ